MSSAEARNDSITRPPGTSYTSTCPESTGAGRRLPQHTASRRPSAEKARSRGYQRAFGLLGLGMADVSTLRALPNATPPRARSVIFIFLTGGLSHLDSFDLKPDAPDSIRGEFQSIATRTE